MALQKVKDSMRTTVAIDATKLTTGTIPEARITTLDATKLTGTIAVGRLDNAPATDLISIKQDILILALSTAVDNNKVAHNLPNAFIDQFEGETGLATKTTVGRNSVGEYISSVQPGTGKTATLNANSGTAPVMSSTQAMFGTYSAYFAGNGGTLNFADSNDFDFGSGNLTIEYWLYPTTAGRQKLRRGSTDYCAYFLGESGNKAYFSSAGTSWDTVSAKTLGTESTGVWQHYAIARNGNTFTCYRDGVSVATEVTTATVNDRASEILSIGGHTGQPSTTYHGYMDEIRISDTARYTAAFDSGQNGITTITSPAAFTTDANTMLLLHMDDAGLSDSSDPDVVTSVGTLVSTVQTAPATVSEMSGVILYTNGGSGAATLGSGGSEHLSIWFTANLQGTTPNWTGTNWTEAASYGTAQTFSGSKKMVKLGKTPITNTGTACAMKAVWANQAQTTMETRLDGWAMNY